MDFSSVERALQSLGRRRPALDEATVDVATKLLDPTLDPQDYLAGVLFLLQEHHERWEPLAVGLYVATHVISSKESVYVEGPRVPSTHSQEEQVAVQLSTEQLVELCGPLLQACQEHLEHSEPRVRTLVAKAVGAHVRLACQLKDIPQLQIQRRTMHDSIVTSLQKHLQDGRDLAAAKYSHSSTGALDDTTGWRALETNWQGLASYIAACGALYYQEEELTEELLEACRYCCITHVNRHVRAAAIAVLEQLVLALNSDQSNQLCNPDAPLRKTCVQVLKVTLADNWSQVRMAASVLCRTFWTKLQLYEDNHADEAYPALLPRMCLNRFYLAQGVKLYSHDTWRTVFQTNGLELVARHAGPVCRYYVQMCDADNHAVREAACQAVAELAQKLGSSEFADSLASYVPMLLQALLMCFHDESWPVRDEACLACGTFCMAYPQECRPELPTLLTRWTEQLTDQIWSVRQDAGVAMGDALKAYPELLPKFIDLLKTKIPSARDEPAMTKEEYKKRQNDIETHTDSQLYSCGSLAPKLRKGGAGRIGCSSCGITRPKAPWEATDGCIYLLRELTGVLSDEDLEPLMVELADVCRVRHFPQGDDLRTTLWRQLPVMAKSLGKQRFKRLYLHLFLDLLMSNLEERTASALSVHAAGQCAEELANLVGVGIFRGRLEDYQQEVFDRVMEERKHAPKGPSDAFSPFGPAGESPFGPPPTGASPFGPPGAMPGGSAFPPTQHPAAAGVPGNALTETL